MDGAADLELQLVATGANWSATVEGHRVGEGTYEAAVEVPAPGVYYLHVTSAALGLRSGDVPSLALAAAAAASASGKARARP